MPWNLEGGYNAVGYTRAIISKVYFSPEEAGSDTNPLFINAGHEGEYVTTVHALNSGVIKLSPAPQEKQKRMQEEKEVPNASR